MKYVKKIGVLSLITIFFSLILSGIPVAALGPTGSISTPLEGAVLLAPQMWGGTSSFTLTTPKAFAFEELHRYLKMLYPEYYSLSWTVRAGKAEVQALFPAPDQVAEVRRLGEKLVAESIREDMSGEEKLLTLHNLVADRSTYDYQTAMNLQTAREEPFTAYGALVGGSAVCDGYTAAFALLCHIAGIDCVAVISEEMNHSWNAVLWDDQIWYVDVTYNDTGALSAAEGQGATLAYFMVSEEQLSQTHRWNREDTRAALEAAWPPRYRAVQALRQAGVLFGSRRGLELDRTPTRLEATTLLARLLGWEQGGSNPFADVTEADGAVLAGLYEAGLVRGVAPAQFAPRQEMTANQYATMLLRAMGYAENLEFTYATALEDGVALGLFRREDVSGTGAFTREDMILLANQFRAQLQNQPSNR